MAAKYARAVGGNWSADATWSTTTGGAADTVAPTASDDIFLNGSSGNVTIDAASVCRSINCTSYTGTLTHNAFALSVGDATAGASNIALKFVAGMTYTHLSGASIQFISSSATQQTVATGGKDMRTTNFNGSGSSYLLSDGYNTGSAITVTLSQGTLNVNGQTCSWGLFNSSNSATRTLTLGAANITITGSSATTWNLNTITNLTFSGASSTITLSGSTSTFAGNSLTYGNINMTGSQIAQVNHNITCTNFTKTGTAAKTDSLVIISSASITCTGTFTVNSNSDINRVIVQTNTTGTARTITAATAVIGNTVDFQDITGAGAATWTVAGTGATALGDCGGNSGITFSSSVQQTWSGTSGGNWSANAWTTRVPLPQDDVVISSAFSASQTVTADMPRLGRSINWTGSTGSPTWNRTTSHSIYGSLTLIAGMTLSGSSGVTYAGRGSFTITSAGLTQTNNQTFNCPGGTYVPQDAFNTGSSIITLTNGGFVNSGNFNITFTYFDFNNSNTKTLTMGSGTWTSLNTSGNVWISGTTGLTFSGNLSTFVISATSSSTRQFVGGGLTYGTLTYTVAGSTGEFDITGSNTFSAWNMSDASNTRTIGLTAGTTQTVADMSGVDGTSGKPVLFKSLTKGTRANLALTGTQQCDYLTVVDTNITTGKLRARFSNDAGNNIGVEFTGSRSLVT